MTKLQELWNQIQDFLDISGDCWLGLLTAIIAFRYVYAALGHPAITPAEAAAYASAVTAFAATNIGGPKV
jgi:hypothetical protein